MTVQHKLKSAYDELVIFYFSGTGNAENATHWISETFQQEKCKTTVINIGRSNSISVPETHGKTLYGFCYPTHGFNAPPIVLDFILRFPRKKAPVFFVNTRAGMKMSKIFTPGLSGIALILPALIFLFKGYKVIGMRSIDLPSNWIPLHPGLKSNVVESIIRLRKKKTIEFASKISSGKRVFRALFDLPLDIAIIPVSIGYYFIGRFMLAKTYIATNKCTKCGLCIKQCPVKAIHSINGKPFWTYKCESCMKCLNSCPQRAIETPHGIIIFFAVLFYLLITLPVVATLRKLGLFTQPGSRWDNDLVLTIATIVQVPLTFLIYRLIFFLMKYRLVNRIVSYTSLTSFAFWRRYKFPKQRKEQ